MDERRLEFRLGLFVLLAFVLLGVGLFVLERNLFEEMYGVKAAFPNASGIERGTPVYMGGVQIGRVERVEFSVDSSAVEVLLGIRRGVLLHEDVAVAIEPKGLIGEKVLEFTFGSAISGFLPTDGTATVPGSVPPSFADLQRSVEGATQDLQKILAQISDIFGDPEVKQNIKQTMANAVETTRKSGEALDEAKAFLEDARLAVEDIRGAADTFREAVTHLDEQVTSNGTHLQAVLASLNESTERMGSVLDDVHQITTRVAEGEGTLGAFLSSDEMYAQTQDLVDSMTEAAKSLRKTSDYIRKHPSSFIWGGGEKDDGPESPHADPAPPRPTPPGDWKRGRR